jgi:hypothetical protein
VTEGSEPKFYESVADNVSKVTGESWYSFNPIDERMLQKVLTDVNKKECESDPIPVKLLLQRVDEVKTIVLYTINESSNKGVFPSDIKTAIVRPAMKDENGDPNQIQSYIMTLTSSQIVLIPSLINFKKRNLCCNNSIKNDAIKIYIFVSSPLVVCLKFLGPLLF